MPTSDVAWHLAGREGQRIAGREAARLVLVAMNHQLAAGIDRFGKPLTPISGRTAASRSANINPVTGHQPYSPMGRASAANAPLQSTGAKSRTRSLLRARPDEGDILVFWADDIHTGVNWGLVLARHAAGFYMRFHDGWGYVPPRDVIGLAPVYLAWFRTRFGEWWKANRRKLARGGLLLKGAPESLILKTPVPPGKKPVVVPTPAATKARKPPARPAGFKPSAEFIRMGGSHAVSGVGAGLLDNAEFGQFR